MYSVVARDEHAVTHVSFPEVDTQTSCFTPVKHDGRRVEPIGPTPRGCAYPNPDQRKKLRELAAELDDVAATGKPHRLSCDSLSEPWRRAAFAHNAKVIRALAERDETRPYTAIVVPGHGTPSQNDTAVLSFVPGEDCRTLRDGDLRRLGAIPLRTQLAADAFKGGTGSVILVSGGAIHSRVNEAFAMLHNLMCREGIPADRVLLEPCADHTHTNLRNAGRWIDAMAGRAGYLLTDPYLQGTYLQDSNGFELVTGSVDQRSLRDWGYVIGSWRQASEGIRSGFWFTPYRFWAEPRDGLGSFTCD